MSTNPTPRISDPYRTLVTYDRATLNDLLNKARILAAYGATPGLIAAFIAKIERALAEVTA